MTSSTIRVEPDGSGRRAFGPSRLDREYAWYAYAHGIDDPVPPPWPPPRDDEFSAPPPGGPGPERPLPLGTTDLLEQTPFPWSNVAVPFCSSFALGHALATTFAPVRREPENPYNDHRSYPSSRCAFPVEAVLATGHRWRPLLAGRRSIAGEDGDGAPTALALTGRYEALAPEYGFFRSTLVNLELGIVLRSLAIALSLFGVPAWLRMPSTAGAGLLRRLGSEAAARWSLPAVVTLDGAGAAEPANDPVTPLVPRVPPLTDRWLGAVLDADRASAVDAAPVRLGSGIPRQMFRPADRCSWAEVFWRRTSGQMPRGLHGMSARPRTVPRRTLTDALRWLAVPPPTPLLAAVRDAVRLTVVTGQVADTPPGVHRLDGDELVEYRSDPAAPARLEAIYGYPASPHVGCEIRHAAATWLFSVRPRPVVEQHGPAGWAALQHVVGWLTQGLCLAASGAGMFARPVGAFAEDGVRDICDLDTDEMVILAVVTGVDRHQGGPRLDLRL